MKFTHFVDLTDSRPKKSKKLDAIEEQLDYMYGAMANDDHKGVPRGDHKISINKTEQLEENLTRVHYDFEGTVLLQKGPRKYNTFPLPRIPTEEGIYEPAVDKKTGINKATDEHYQGFGDYWYFWNPIPKKSKLIEGEHYDIVKAEIERVKNTKRTFPEYDRLINKKDNSINISAFFGMDDAGHSKNVTHSRDLGAEGFRGFVKGLKQMGFTETFSNHKSLKKYEKETPQGNIIITVFYGATGIDESSSPFHRRYKEALENSAVIIYDGHSGLGEHLDLDSIESARKFKIKHHPTKYQIMFFNSCSSYSYYNLSYQILKGKRYATKSLDLLTNGLETEFDAEQKSNLALVNAIDAWATEGKKDSYQNLSKVMDTANLFVVSGDEDNASD